MFWAYREETLSRERTLGSQLSEESFGTPPEEMAAMTGESEVSVALLRLLTL